MGWFPIVIANIEAIVMDEGLEQMDRSERIPAMNLPIGLGDQNRRYYYHAKLNEENIIMHELAEPPGGQKGGKIQMSMDWDDKAVQGLMDIPVALRKMVAERLEEHAKAKGAAMVTTDHMTEMAEEYGIDEELMARFKTD